MKASRRQRFIAQGWPIRIWLLGIPLLFACLVARESGACLGSLSDLPALGWFGLTVLLALFLGYFAALLIGWFVIGPIYYTQGLCNGAPFAPGDRVMILAGPHRDKVATVYSLWQGDSVRVDLGAEDRELYRDIFLPAELLRANESVENNAFIERHDQSGSFIDKTVSG